MTDARIAFRQLRDGAGVAYDARAMHEDLDAVEHRVERARVGRAIMSTAFGLIFVLGAGALAAQFIGDEGVTPGSTPSATPSAMQSSPTTSPTTSAIDELSLPCTVVSGIQGNPVGDLGGLEGWFNAQSTYPMCESKDNWTEWEHLAAAHPDTVLINTIDNTMIEAYYRTIIEALGVYATLSGDFEVPNPDPSWPAHSAVLIDPTTGEVLEVTNFEEMDGFDATTGEFDFSGLP